MARHKPGRRKPIKPRKVRATPWTMSIPAAGRKYYDLGRNASYREAAKPPNETRLPTIDVGGLKLVVVSRVEKMLGGE
jgi:hypothetical protein